MPASKKTVRRVTAGQEEAPAETPEQAPVTQAETAVEAPVMESEAPAETPVAAQAEPTEEAPAARGPFLRITLTKSGTGYKYDQKRTLAALGLRRLNGTVERPDNPSVRGMVNKVQHLVRVEEIGQS